MSALSSRVHAVLPMAAGACLLTLALGRAAGLRINVTPSLPLGLYRTSSDAPTRGSLVLVCPSPTALSAEAKARGYLEAGHCPGGYGYLMKRLWGLPHDAIAVRDAGVWVNNERVPNSTPLEDDLGGRALPRYRAELVLGPQQYLVMSEMHPASFDGRYFGPVRAAQVISVLRPLWLWNGGM
jgi:conjugative transfer signal peptidase TraF